MTSARGPRSDRQAGIDRSLWLVGQIWDVERARRTQRMMEYDPAPPYTAEV